MLTTLTIVMASLPLIFGEASLVATDVIRAGDRITTSNTALDPSDNIEGETLLGREVRRTVYAGQKIDPGNTQSPRLVKRNQTVTVKYITGGLEITVSGRALGEAGLGETVDVMNTESRNVISGTVTEQGWILAK